MNPRSLFVPLLCLCAVAFPVAAQNSAPPPKPPLVSDPALRIEVVVSYPDVETPTTVAVAPDGAIYIGNDPRDSRLSTKSPECTIVRYSSMRADRKRTVFADKLYSPAGSLWFDGWLYVIHDPLLTRFKDTDGDGVADVREDLVSNLGIPPNEGLNDHVVSGFTLGMDGFFYISVGDRGIYQAKSAKDGSEVTLQGGGIVRCRPDGSQLEIFSGGTRNHLEVDLDAFDRAFTRDNTDDGNGWWTRVTHHIEGGYYGYPFYFKEDTTNGLLAPGPQKPQFTATAVASNERFLPAMTDFGGGSPTGGLVYMSDGLPEQYRGVPFFAEWGKSGVFATELVREGATFKVAKDTAVAQADKGADFRPMQLYVATDGSLLIADWGFGGWKSPKPVGTVWRLSWPEAKPSPRVPDTAPVPELIAALAHVDRDQRLRAQWALIHKGEKVLPALIEVLHDGAAPPLKKAHALWALDLIGDASPETRSKVTGLIRQVLADTAPEVRAQAIRELAIRNVSAATDEIVKLLKDTDPEVRLQSAIALGRIGAKSAVPALLAALGEEDRWIRFSARVALEKIADWPQVAPALQTQDSRVREQAWLAFDSVFDPGATAVLVRLASDPDAATRARAAAALARSAYMPAAYEGHWWATQPVKNPPPLCTVAWAGTSKALEALSAALADSDATVRLAAAKAFTQFRESEAPDAHKLPGGKTGLAGTLALPTLRARMTAETDAGVRRQLIESLGVQKDPQAMDVFMKIAVDEKADAEFRETAIGAVVNIGGDAAKKTIAQLADAKLSPAATRKIIQAAGELKVLEAAPALIAHLKDENAGNREFSAKSLQQLGSKANAGAALIGALADKDNKVVAAAIEALGSMREKSALPALIALAEKKKFSKETIQAISNMPDGSAIPVLVETLRDKNTGVRRNALKALKTMREKAWPLVQELIASGRVPEELVPEIRNYFQSGAITKWKVIGPFENVWGAVHPPESEALAAGGKPDLSAKHHNAEGKDVGWQEVTGDADTGKVNLEAFFKSNAMVCAYAFAEIEAPEEADAKILCGGDDQIAIWLNGKKIHDRGESRGFDPDSDEVPIHFAAGSNLVFVKIGNLGGSWVFSARVPGLDGLKFVKSKEPTPEEKQTAFALAAKPDGSWVHPGDAAKGEKVYRDPTGPLGGICATCHAIAGKGGQIGPDLGAIAANYKRADLITSILEPSKTIALGFEQVMIETAAGDSFFGALRAETADSLKVVGADGVPHDIKRADVKKRTDMKTSLMPQGLTLAIKPEDFTDLIAYLETLKGK